MSTQPDLGPNQRKYGSELFIEDSETISSHSELHSLFVKELSNIEVAPMKEAMVLGAKETVTEAIELGF